MASRRRRTSGPSGGRLAAIGLVLLLVLQVVVTARSGGSARAADVTTLVVWDGFDGPAGEAADAVYAAFVAENPEIAIERRAVAEAATTPDALARALASGVGPDLVAVRVDAEFRRGLATFGLLVPLNELPVRTGWTDRLDGVAQRWTRRDGRLLALPVEQSFLGLVLNQSLLDEAGLRPPRTDAELLELCRQARAKGYTPIAVGADPAAELSDLFAMVLNNLIGPTLAKNLLFTDWGLWHTSRVEWAIRLVAVEMPRAGCYDVDAAAPADPRARFVAGRTLILPVGSAAARDLQAAMPGTTLAMVPFPRMEGGRSRVLPTTVEAAYGLPLRSAHPRESAQLLDFLVSEEAARIWVERGGVVPPVGFDVGGWELSPLQETVLDLPARARRRSLIRSTRVEFGYGIGPAAPEGFEAALAAALDAVRSGDRTPEQAAIDLQAAWVADRDAEPQ